MKTKAFKEGKLDFIGLNYYFSSVSTPKENLSGDKSLFGDSKSIFRTK